MKTIKEIISKLQEEINNCDCDDEDISWGMENGILISKSEAKSILNALIWRDPKKELPEMPENEFFYVIVKYPNGNCVLHRITQKSINIIMRGVVEWKYV